jgi:hypothetical protein
MFRRPTHGLDVHPLTPDGFDDLVNLFNGRGGAQVRWCRCMYYRRSGAGEWPGGTSIATHNRESLKALVDAGTVPGLIGYRHGKPVVRKRLGR